MRHDDPAAICLAAATPAEIVGEHQPGLRASGQPPETRVHRSFQDPHQRHDQRLLPHVKPGDSPADDHALDLRRALENREAPGDTGSFRR
jgi:hypothetical protein